MCPLDPMYYEMIFKRKSFHLFKETGKITVEEVEAIKEKFCSLQPLNDHIRTEIVIADALDTTCKRGEEYCILFYSEKKENYLQNIGYIGEQLDLYLASLDIGTLWFGIGKTEETQRDGLDFVIMIAISKVMPGSFRKDMFKSKRKALHEVWKGDLLCEIGNIARFAPSACNTQPWIAETEADRIIVYRHKKPGKRGIMPANKVTYYNRIDIGIFLLILEVCLAHNNIEFERKLYDDFGESLEELDAEKTPAAEYILVRKGQDGGSEEGEENV